MSSFDAFARLHQLLCSAYVRSDETTVIIELPNRRAKTLLLDRIQKETGEITTVIERGGAEDRFKMFGINVEIRERAEKARLYGR